jgi:hypothetical protein
MPEEPILTAKMLNFCIQFDIQTNWLPRQLEEAIRIINRR